LNRIVRAAYKRLGIIHVGRRRVRDLTDFIEDRRIDTVIDVGANVGQFGESLRAEVPETSSSPARLNLPFPEKAGSTSPCFHGVRYGVCLNCGKQIYSAYQGPWSTRPWRRCVALQDELTSVSEQRDRFALQLLNREG